MPRINNRDSWSGGVYYCDSKFDVMSIAQPKCYIHTHTENSTAFAAAGLSKRRPVPGSHLSASNNLHNSMREISNGYVYNNKTPTPISN